MHPRKNISKTFKHIHAQIEECILSSMNDNPDYSKKELSQLKKEYLKLLLDVEKMTAFNRYEVWSTTFLHRQLFSDIISSTRRIIEHLSLVQSSGIILSEMNFRSFATSEGELRYVFGDHLAASQRALNYALLGNILFLDIVFV